MYSQLLGTGIGDQYSWEWMDKELTLAWVWGGGGEATMSTTMIMATMLMTNDYSNNEKLYSTEPLE